MRLGCGWGGDWIIDWAAGALVRSDRKNCGDIVFEGSRLRDRRGG